MRTHCCPLKGHVSICGSSSCLLQIKCRSSVFAETALSRARAESCRAAECSCASRGASGRQSGPRAAPCGSTPCTRRFARARISLTLFNPHHDPMAEGCVAAHLLAFFPSSLPLLILPRKDDILICSTFFHPILNLALHKPHCNTSHVTLSKRNKQSYPLPVICHAHFTDEATEV